MELIKKVLAEFVGSFFFFSVILSSITYPNMAPIVIGIGLIAATFFSVRISGSYFNPAVSVMMFAKGAITLDVLILFILAQVLAGLFALATYNFYYTDDIVITK